MPAEGEYLRLEDFFELDLRELVFFADEPRVPFFALVLRVLFLAAPRDALLREERDREEPLLEPDFFLAAFFVAMTILLGGQMTGSLEQVVSAEPYEAASRCTHV